MNRHLLRQRKPFLDKFEWTLIILASVELSIILLQHGYELKQLYEAQWIFVALDVLVLIVFILVMGVKFWRSESRLGFIKRNIIFILLFLYFAGLSVFRPVSALKLLVFFIIARQLFLVVQAATRTNWGRVLVVRLQTHPAVLISLSFLFVILSGTLFLTFPRSTNSHQGADVLTAFFTATSATCVTGLIVVDTPVYFSRFGQTVIIFLMQIGGLGIMTLSTATVFILGRSLGVTGRRVMENLLDESLLLEMRRSILYIIGMTFIVEGLGGLLLFLRWRHDFDVSTAIYLAIFHTVSAFCNAGFALFSDNLASYAGDFPINLTITTLIILGGIGFTVVASVINMNLFRKGPKRVLSLLPVHTRLVVFITVLLILGGTILIFFFEYDNKLLDLPLQEKLLASYFQSVTTRTAGFNTIDIGGLKAATLFIMVLLMFIGASPGGTGGGIKTTTFGVLALSLRAMLLGRKEVEVYGRTIPQTVVYKSIAIGFLSAGFLSIILILLLSVEKASFIQLLFEAVSAFGTVGLSTGITSALTSVGKFLLCIAMFVGRVGPLTLAIAVGEKSIKAVYRYPDGKVMVG